MVHVYSIGYMSHDPLGDVLGKRPNGDKLSNSGNILKLMVPNYIRKYISGWTNYSGKVKSHKMSENEMDNRGSKSDFISKSVKEQRVDGSWCIKKRLMRLRYTIMGFERNYRVKIPSKQLIVQIFSSTLNSSPVKPLCSLNKSGIRKYSSSTIITEPKSGKGGEPFNFYEWLAGFTDGEGLFIIEKRGPFINFTFRITLHKDDIFTLYYIKTTLGEIGNVKIFGNTARLTITSQKDIAKLMDIFSKYLLDTIKLLNLLDFKRAFELYTSSNNKSKKSIRQEITNIKRGMNSLKTDFQMPEGHKPRITPYWLLGFVEGEGSFFINKTGYNLTFVLTQSAKDLALMEAIKDFFYYLPGIDIKTINKSLIGVN